MSTHRKHYFTDVGYHVITLLLPTGEYGAYRAVEDEGRIRGFGHTRLAAIADLKEWLEDQADDGDSDCDDGQGPRQDYSTDANEPD